jgi:hypothetical protein
VGWASPWKCLSHCTRICGQKLNSIEHRCIGCDRHDAIIARPTSGVCRLNVVILGGAANFALSQIPCGANADCVGDASSGEKSDRPLGEAYPHVITGNFPEMSGAAVCTRHDIRVCAAFVQHFVIYWIDSLAYAPSLSAKSALGGP